ncbi:hypothetical protein AB0K89_04175 [Streptomyces cinnamoneus]|uniref:hypothetical protein n=1 Tax=Streptomyces cinnamoneus TaxID=53446 RepID=UPI0034354AE4
MNRTRRLVLTTTLTTTLLTGAVAAAAAAPSPTLTATASVTTVGAWQEFRVTGKATGIKPGAQVTLQQKQGKKWVSLPASAPVNKTATYSLRVKLGIKGKNTLRMTGSGAISPEFTVTVR